MTETDGSRAGGTEAAAGRSDAAQTEAAGPAGDAKGVAFASQGISDRETEAARLIHQLALLAPRLGQCFIADPAKAAAFNQAAGRVRTQAEVTVGTLRAGRRTP